MATSSVEAEESGSHGGLNPRAEAFFPPSTTVFVSPTPTPHHSHFFPYSPLPVPPFHFFHPSSLAPPRPPPPPHSSVPNYLANFIPYTPPPPTSSPVLQEVIPAASYGRGCNHRPRGRGSREGRGGRVPRGRLPLPGRDLVVRCEDKGFDGSEHSRVGKESTSSVSLRRPRYERVVKVWRHHELVDRRKKPVVPLCQGGAETTVMIRNIPNKYTRDLLIEFLDRHCASENQKLETDGNDEERSAYDFVYLPLDLRRKANLGYAFVNFTDPRAAWRFYSAAEGQTWELFCSKKVREVVSARLQGKDELVRHFQRTMFACESEDFLPVCFSPPRDGSGNQVTQRSVGGFTATKY